MAKQHPKQSEIVKILNQAGLRPFTDQEVLELSSRLENVINIGLNRSSEPTTDDGGVLAAPTHVDALSQEQINNIPDHTRGLTAACGGTNWIFAETQKEPSGQVVIGRSFVRNIPENERQHTYEGFAEIIADGLARVAAQCNLLDQDTLPVSVSLGFPQINLETKQGDIDALLPRADLPKFWTITDYDSSLPPNQQPSLGQFVKNKLKARGISGADKIVILNDTVAVALDVQSKDAAPLGFVFGTGTNGAMYAGPDKGLVNLEIGHAEIMDKDQILTTMRQNSWAPDNRKIMEYWMGGAFIPARVMAGLELLADYVSSPDTINTQIKNSSNQALITDMASGRESPLVGLSVIADDYLVAQACARRAMTQAGQTIGIHLGTVAKLAGYTTGKISIPFEGSLLSKGFGIKRQALKTAQLIVPDLTIKPYEANGSVGVAKLALVRNR